MTEGDNNEIHQSYQKLVKEKEFLETENYMLKEEVKRLIRYAPISSVTHSRSVSNVSSVNIDEDFGYSSSKNTLEIKKESFSSATDKNGDRDRNGVPDLNHTPEAFADMRKYYDCKHINSEFYNQFVLGIFSKLDASTPKRHHVMTVLKMKKSLQEELNKRKKLEEQLNRIQLRAKGTVNTEDSMRYVYRVVPVAKNFAQK